MKADNGIDEGGKWDYIMLKNSLETFPATFPRPCMEGEWHMTIKDVARHCGVSVSTVSRVLNQKPDVSESVRAAVLEAVRQLNYVPHTGARELVMPASDTVGLVIRGDSSEFYAEIIAAIEHTLKLAGYSLVIENARHGEDELWAGASLVRSKRLKGLIFLGGCFDYEAGDIEKLDVPFVCCTYTNIFGSLPAGSYSSVTIDDIKTGHDATMQLINRGHRRIAVVLSTADDRSISELRCMGYRRALEEKGIEFDPELVIEAGEYSMAAARRSVGEAIAAGLDFSAVFAVSDNLAIAVMKALSDAGKRVPEDCSVLGIDGIEMAEYTLPSLSTFAQPTHELGEHSARILINIIEGRGEAEHILLEPGFVKGGSLREI